MNLHWSRTGSLVGRLAWLTFLCAPFVAAARDFRVNQLPNGSRFGCATCHVSSGGGGARNPFGQAVNAIVRPGQATPFWSPTLAALDSDGDGTTNGAELGDPEGDGQATAGATVTNPGSATSKPPANAAPKVTLTAPQTGVTLFAPALAAVEATATDSDGTVAKVEFLDGDRLLGVDTEAPYTLLVDWSLGNHTVTARATDNKGATATSTAVAMTVSAPSATRISRVARNGDNVEVDWSAGGGPYQVQTKAGLADPWCAAGDMTVGLTASIPARGTGGFLRVADLAVGEAIPMTVVMAGAFERPTPVATQGGGSGTLKIEGNTLTFNIEYHGLSGPATLAHIHGNAGPDAAAGVLINLAPFNGGAFGTSGTLAGSVVLTLEQKAAILSGKTYVNVHTDANKPGEIRGQVMPVALGASLSGAQEAPNPVVTEGKGSAHFALSGNQLTFVITYAGLSGPATLAHIHGPAAPGASAGVLIDLVPFHDGPLGASGRFEGTLTLTSDQQVSLMSGLTYVNIHTAANKPGEIRGQILACPTGVPLGTSLSGANEVPAVATAGVGRAILRLEGDVLSFDIRYGGLTGAATLAHIHGPAPASGTAGVMIDLMPFRVGTPDVAGAFSGAVVLTADQKSAVLSGLTYVNVHTAANKPGEVRGQILRQGLP